MTTPSVDTLRIVKRLRDAGFTEAQAETVTALIQEVHDTGLSTVTSKADLALVRVDLEIRGRDLTIRIGAMLAASTLVLLAAHAL